MKGHGKDMTQRQLMEKLELNEEETIETVAEWLSSSLRNVKPTGTVECPKCGEEFVI